MKRIFAFVLILSLLCAMLGGCAENGTTTTTTETEETREPLQVAMVSNDPLFENATYGQVVYEAMKTWCDTNGVQCGYYRRIDDSTDSRVEAMEQAIADGYNILLLPGYAFGGAIVELAPKYPDVKFIGIDVGASDLLEAAVSNAGECYDYNPDNWKVEDYVHMSNVYCCTYREEVAGYMAGYAAVKMGYTELGFIGYMAVPAIIRYGYGFVQGADAAACEIGADVHINYIYAGCSCHGIGVEMPQTWYKSGTQVIFACGAGNYTDVAEAAVKFDGKIIGVDLDMGGIIDGMYGEGMTVTSAMKDLGATVETLLGDIAWKTDGNWEAYSGKIALLDSRFVALPESTQWCESFTKQDYEDLAAKLADGTLTVSDDISCEPVTNITVEYLGSIKG